MRFRAQESKPALSVVLPEELLAPEKPLVLAELLETEELLGHALQSRPVEVVHAEWWEELAFYALELKLRPLAVLLEERLDRALESRLVGQAEREEELTFCALDSPHPLHPQYSEHLPGARVRRAVVPI